MSKSRLCSGQGIAALQAAFSSKSAGCPSAGRGLRAALKKGSGSGTLSGLDGRDLEPDPW